MRRMQIFVNKKNNKKKSKKAEKKMLRKLLCCFAVCVQLLSLSVDSQYDVCLPSCECDDQQRSPTKINCQKIPSEADFRHASTRILAVLGDATKMKLFTEEKFDRELLVPIYHQHMQKLAEVRNEEASREHSCLV